MSAPIFIDALSFAQERKSGIGHISEELSLALAEEISRTESGRVINLVVPLGKTKYVKKYVSRTIKVKTIPLPSRVLHVLNNHNLLPPLDILLGRGIYVFPNYRNWKLAHSKSLTYLHDLSYMHFESFVEPKNLAYLKRNIPTWVKRADIIITASHYTKDEITNYLQVEESKVSVIPHGVDAKKFHYVDQAARANTLKAYGIDSDKFLLHVGNIEPRKNITGLIKAYRRLPKDITDEHPLLLIGGGGWLNEAENEAIVSAVSSGFNILKPDKYVVDEDLSSFYSSASSLVMPSHYEGFGIPPLQAMACNLPTVVSDNSSLHEIFSGASILVDSKDIDSIRAGMLSSIKMSSRDLERYRKNANAIVSAYSWSAAAKKLLRTINKVSDA